jgi:ATP-binding cassette subfamily B protein
MLKSLWPYAKKHWGMLLASLLSVLGVAVTSRLMPYVIGKVVDEGFIPKDWELVKKAAFIYLGLEIFHAFLIFLSAYLFNWFGNRMLFYLREDLHRHTQNLPLDYFNRTPLGRTVTRLTNDTTTLGEVFTDGLITLFTSFVIMISIVVAMLVISVKLTLATMALAPLFIYAGYRVTQKIREVLRDSKMKLSVLNSFVAENLNGIRVIQLFNRGARNTVQFGLFSKNYRDASLDSIKYNAILQPVMNLFTAVTVAIAMGYGGYLGQQNYLPLGLLVAFIMNAQDFIHPLREVLEKFQQFQNSLTSAERVFQLIEQNEEPNPQGADSVHSLAAGHLRIENLSFKYQPDMPWVLQNINFQVPRGKSVAIVGRTGSGKSTLISLMQKFYLPPENTIFFDQVAIEKIPLKQLRSHLGVVQQDNFIFRGTIAENVSLADPRLSEEDILRALQQVGYMQLLARTGRNIHSKVEEKGANLSAGERQLLAFARILAFAPEILILDEATANIDSESEKLIQRATKKVIQNRTSIIIAHRLSTIQECDQILVLDHGQIIEQGTHTELLTLRGAYYHFAVAGEKETLILE